MNATAALVFARCAGFVFRAPGFSHPAVPPPVRAAIALLLAVCLSPAVRAGAAPAGAAFVFALGAELATGAAIGFGASVLYDGAYAGGRLLDDYAGIRAGIPAAGVVSAGSFGRLWSNALLAAFFLLDGYRYVVLVFARGFDAVPPGALVQTESLARFALAIPTLVLTAAVEIAGPAVAVVFAAQFALGALSRAIPRFASFTLSFPVVFGAALIVAVLMIPLLAPLGGRPWVPFP